MKVYVNRCVCMCVCVVYVCVEGGTGAGVCVCVRSFSVLYYAGRMWALRSEHKLIKLILPIGCHVLPTILMVEISPYAEAISTST